MVTYRTSTIFDPLDSSSWPLLLTISETAEILRVSEWTLRQWDKKELLKAVRLGSRRDRRYKKDDILNIVNKGLN